MSEMVDRVANAWDLEWGRWVTRVNKMADHPAIEACRYDDSGMAGSFSEVHSLATLDETAAKLKFRKLRREAAARAAIAAMREPTDAMTDAAFACPDNDDCGATVAGVENIQSFWRAMIDEAPK